MIDLSEHQGSQISRQCAYLSNSIEVFHELMEMLMAQDDNEAVACYALSIAKKADKIADVAAYLATKGAE